MKQKQQKEIILKGIPASSGICAGAAYIVDKEGVKVVKKYVVTEQNIKKEINRFKTAVKKVQNNLKEIIEDNLESADIIETHIALLNDKEFYNKVAEIIEKKQVNAEWALKKVTADLTAKFKSMEASYLKDRAEDIIHISDKIMKSLIGIETVNIKTIDKRVILVARDLSPAEVSQIQLEFIKGFITDGGGKTSHTGIVARNLQIPAVLGLKNATRIINNEDIIIIDGNEGQVIVSPSDNTLAVYEEKKEKYENFKAAISRKAKLPAQTKDGFIIHVLGNIELSEEVVSVIDHGGSGIGLFRTEFEYISGSGFPTEARLFEKYKGVIEVMSPHPVTIRTLDINGDKAFNFMPSKEANPALGLRAVRYCLAKPDIFITQLRAILRASAFGNVKIMLPMIANKFEIIKAKELLYQAALSLEKENIDFKKDIEIGIMIEVPAAVITADLLAEEADFFSIGTNDLIQYVFAADRGNAEVSHLFEPLHPAILRMIKHTCDIAEYKGISVAICGEMGSDPLNLPILLGLGIKEFSMNPQSIPHIKEMLRNISVEDAKNFANKILKYTDITKITEAAQKKYEQLTKKNNSAS
ncbi:MAG: phosphoenolpyruvate--protein phosphotransferase [Deltaproteobacteria bacterium]|nr:phosphoenolpyruvate--protein phosphotransferase [Deltaproteobacteria bacterium]